MSEKRLTREESQRQTRRKLLNVAAKMFAERGFYDTSVDRIAETAGFSKGAVYSNFGSKNDLFIEVFREHQQREIRGLKKIIESCETIDEFVQLIEANHEQGQTEEQAWSALKLEFLLHAMRNEETRKKLAELLQENRQQMEGILQYFYDRSNISHPLTMKKLAYLLLSLDIGIGIQTFLSGKDIPENTFADGLDLLLKP